MKMKLTKSRWLSILLSLAMLVSMVIVMLPSTNAISPYNKPYESYAGSNYAGSAAGFDWGDVWESIAVKPNGGWNGMMTADEQMNSASQINISSYNPAEIRISGTTAQPDVTLDYIYHWSISYPFSPAETLQGESNFLFISSDAPISDFSGYEAYAGNTIYPYTLKNSMIVWDSSDAGVISNGRYGYILMDGWLDVHQSSAQLTFYSNGGYWQITPTYQSNNMGTSVNYGEPLSYGHPGIPIRDGYVFLGFSENSASGSPLFDLDNYYVNGNEYFVFYAQWAPIGPYTVVYDPGVPYSYVTASWDREEHDDLYYGDDTPPFQGSTDSDYPEYFLFSTWKAIPLDKWPLVDPRDYDLFDNVDDPTIIPVTESMVYEAVYLQKSGILVVYEPGEGGNWDYQGDYNLVYEYIEVIATPDDERHFPAVTPAMTIDGYNFVQFELNTAKSRDISKNPSTGLWSGAEFWTAQWTQDSGPIVPNVPNVRIYPGTHGNFGDLPFDNYIEQAATGGTLGGLTYPLSTFEAFFATEDSHDPGWKFVGWNQPYDSDDPLTEDVDFIAQWEAIPYDITYYMDEQDQTPGDPGDNPATYTVADSDITLLPPKASRPGYHFIGWVDGNGNPVSTITNGSTGDLALYAVWAVGSEYSVTVDGSYAGAGNTGAGSYAKGETVTIRAGSRAGYTFAGWTVTSGGVTLASPGSATTTFTMPEGGVTVTANWTYSGGYDGGGDDTTITTTTTTTTTTVVTDDPQEEELQDEGTQTSTNRQENTQFSDIPEPYSELPPPAATVEGNTVEQTEDGAYIELDPTGVALGEWVWDEDLGEWTFNEYPPPLANLPQTGLSYSLAPILAALGLTMTAAGLLLPILPRKKEGA